MQTPTQYRRPHALTSAGNSLGNLGTGLALAGFGLSLLGGLCALVGGLLGGREDSGEDLAPGEPLVFCQECGHALVPGVRADNGLEALVCLRCDAAEPGATAEGLAARICDVRHDGGPCGTCVGACGDVLEERREELAPSQGGAESAETSPNQVEP